MKYWLTSVIILLMAVVSLTVGELTAEKLPKAEICHINGARDSDVGVLLEGVVITVSFNTREAHMQHGDHRTVSPRVVVPDPLGGANSCLVLPEGE